MLDSERIYNPLEDGVTQSALSTFLECERRTDLRILRGIKKVSGEELFSFGKSFHTLLHVLYGYFARTGHIPSVIDLVNWYEDYERTHTQVTQEFETNLAKIEAVLQAYVETWRDDFTVRNWVELEQTFDFPFTLPSGRTVRLCGKRDGVSRSKADQTLQLFETKTKTQINDYLIGLHLNIDLQTQLYALSILNDYRVCPEGGLYNVVRNPSLRYTPGKKETLKVYRDRIYADAKARPEHYFFRYHVIFEESRLLEWRDRWLGPMIDRFVDWCLRPKDLISLENPTKCVTGGVKCAYLEYCATGETEDLIQLLQVHPELEDEDLISRFQEYNGSHPNQA